MARIVPVVLAVAVWIYGIIHCALTKKEAMPGRVPKWGWMTLNILLPVIGAIIWFVALYTSRAEGSGVQESAGPVAPDDDPDFLAHLERENRFREWERQQKADSDPDSSEPLTEEELFRNLEKDMHTPNKPQDDENPNPPA